MQISISNVIGRAISLGSYASKLIKAFKARVLSYPTSIFEAEACLDATLTELNAIGLLKKASLVITPNAYNEGILYDVVPNTTLGDMNVVRATTATRVNSAGLIEVVPRNLALYSEQFDTFWAKTNATIIPNIILSPSGLINADKMTADATLAQIQYATTGTISTPYTVSFWIKRITGSGQVYIRSVENLNTPITITNEWVRYSLTTTTTSTNVRIGIALQTIGDEIAIWGAQLEQGSTATEYFPTTTRLNIPRIDYTNGSCPSILVEPIRTNLMLRSEEFSNAVVWTTSNSSVTANTAISPSGILNADKAILNIGVDPLVANAAGLSQNQTITSGVYTYSIFAKAGERNIIRWRDSGFSGNYLAVNLTNGTFTNGEPTRFVNPKVIPYNNGWYRISFTTGTITNPNVYPLRFGDVGQTGDGLSGGFVWGAQLEAGSYATSYIPTVASTVTRNADVISKTGISSLINSQAGTMFIEASALANNTTARFIELNNGSNTLTNNVYFRYEPSSNYIAFTVFSGGILQCNISYLLPLTQIANNKMAFVWSLNRFEIWVNGSKVVQDTLGVPPVSSTLSKIIFSDRADANKFEGNLKSLQIYKEALTNTELQSLTTL